MFKRIDGRIDINSELQSGNIKFDEEEQRGARTNKFWFNNYEYMYKDVYHETYEDYAELIAYRLSEYLGIKSAFYDLAIYNGNKGVITRNLVLDNENEEMLSGTEIITQVYTEYILPINEAMKEYESLTNKYNARSINEFSKLPYEKQVELKEKLMFLVNSINSNNSLISNTDNNIDLTEIKKIYEYLDSFIDIYNQDFIEMKNGIIKSNNLYDIWNVIEIYSRINKVNVNIEEFMNNLINMFIFDIITSQGDRHADNWSIIKNNKDNSIRLCPLYDNSGICSLNRGKSIKNIVDYVNDLNNPLIHEKKKRKIKELLSSTINHSNSGIKVSLDDVKPKSKNPVMMSEYIEDSSQEFNDKLMQFIELIDEGALNKIFLEVEGQINNKVPDDIKLIVKTVVFNNIDMIKEIYMERGKVK